MKIRNGFVSNSSSSSFIIGIDPNIPLKTEDISEYFFGSKNDVVLYRDTDIEVLSHELANSMIKQMVEYGVANEGTLVEECRGDTDINIDKFKTLSPDNEAKVVYDWEAIERVEIEAATKDARNIIKQMNGKDIYILEYGDENGRWECAVEHGGVLDHPFIIRRSRH